MQEPDLDWIHNLAKTCYVKTGSPHTDHFDYVAFAKLIADRCIEVANQPNGVGDDDVIRISADIKKHFGMASVEDDADDGRGTFFCPRCGIENPTTSCGLGDCGLICNEEE